MMSNRKSLPIELPEHHLLRMPGKARLKR